MRLPRRKAFAGIAAVLAALAAAGAAAALANWVTIDNRNFSTQADVRDIQKTNGGADCVRRYARQAERLRVIAHQGPVICRFTLPLSADEPRSDQLFMANGRIPTGVPKGVRNNAELLLRVRSGGGTFYELRVKPRGREWVLRRHDGALASGTDGAIGTPGDLNRMRLAVTGDEIRPVVNGTNLAGAPLVDPDWQQVTGRKVEFGVRHGASTQTSLPAPFDLLRLRIPDPR